MINVPVQHALGVEIASPSALLMQLKWYLYLRYLTEHAKSTEIWR